MKKNKTLFLLFILGIISLSCTDDFIEPVSIYYGQWSGTYTSEYDQGTWVMIVDEKSNINGKIISSVLNTTYNTNGNVEESGALKITVGQTSSGATFTGEMAGDIASGTWENTNENLHGNWKGSRNHTQP